ncbi:hypothetical protein SacmaDRAFT_0330 [Saccharomonospora marina XMU15]|uniref:Secreted protein n=1 Tax=Saccharomonospora marina XMU15 TaxID=882083 RepID=H5X1B3_9PSEU|nr:hypothetical protein [Saccharomonospora marina]EHR48637.1 hypothetical protein SacmaDRAFT_0330 [Saccharomonospora marina XMU15]
MNTAVKLSAYGAALVLLAGGGYAIGAGIGPLGSEDGSFVGHGSEHGQADGDAANSARPSESAGLASAAGGYTFSPVTTTLTRAATTDFAFRITGSDGAPVTRFDVEHSKRMHLIVVRRDGVDFQHAHPEMAADGTWTVPLKPAHAGSYRAFADFTPAGGEPTTLGFDVAVPGQFRPLDHEPSRVAEADGYQVRLDGDLVPGKTSKVTLSITSRGRQIRDLQPYLDAYGHLVALRDGDLAYLHVHPDGSPGDRGAKPGPEVTFHVEVPSAGTYRLFFEFQHGGKVRGAAFTVRSAAAVPTSTSKPAHSTEAEHGHGGHG